MWSLRCSSWLHTLKRTMCKSPRENVFRPRSPALERSRQTRLLKDAARRGSGNKCLPLHLPPNEPRVSGRGDQTYGSTASPQRRAGGERNPCSRLCRIDERTSATSRPHPPVATSCDPTDETSTIWIKLWIRRDGRRFNGKNQTAGWHRPVTNIPLDRLREFNEKLRIKKSINKEKKSKAFCK